MSNKRGYSIKAKRVMNDGTVGATWKYGSSTNSYQLDIPRYSSPSDRLLLRVTRYYHTVSYVLLTAIKNGPPMPLDAPF